MPNRKVALDAVPVAGRDMEEDQRIEEVVNKSRRETVPRTEPESVESENKHEENE